MKQHLKNSTQELVSTLVEAYAHVHCRHPGLPHVAPVLGSESGHRAYVDLGPCELHGFDFNKADGSGMASRFEYEKEIANTSIVWRYLVIGVNTKAAFGYFLKKKS